MNTSLAHAMIPSSAKEATLVYAIVFEFAGAEKREVIRKLGGVKVCDSTYLVDRSDLSARTVYASIVDVLVAETGLSEDEVFEAHDRLYVFPVAAVAGRGVPLVDSWIARRGL